MSKHRTLDEIEQDCVTVNGTTFSGIMHTVVNRQLNDVPLLCEALREALDLLQDAEDIRDGDEFEIAWWAREEKLRKEWGVEDYVERFTMDLMERKSD